MILKERFFLWSNDRGVCEILESPIILQWELVVNIEPATTHDWDKTLLPAVAKIAEPYFLVRAYIATQIDLGVAAETYCSIQL